MNSNITYALDQYFITATARFENPDESRCEVATLAKHGKMPLPADFFPPPPHQGLGHLLKRGTLFLAVSSK